MRVRWLCVALLASWATAALAAGQDHASAAPAAHDKASAEGPGGTICVVVRPPASIEVLSKEALEEEKRSSKEWAKGVVLLTCRRIKIGPTDSAVRPAGAVMQPTEPTGPVTPPGPVLPRGPSRFEATNVSFPATAGIGIACRGGVVIEGEGFVAKADELEYVPAANRLRLQSRGKQAVELTIQQSDGPAKSVIVGQRIEFYLAQKLIRVEGGPTIQFGTSKEKADTGESDQRLMPVPGPTYLPLPR